MGEYDLIPPAFSFAAIVLMSAFFFWGAVKMLERRLG